MNRETTPRTPGYVYSVLVLALLAILATFALTSRQPPPPTIAEFAPQSVDNITDAPTDQSSSSGKGPGECREGAECAGQPSAGTSAVPTPPPIDVPRVRRCIGDPPRQIEDPQSPPCVPYWAGDNGGATSFGVTRDEIRIAAPGYDGSDNQLAKIIGFFNRRFEFYGRRINLLALETPDDNPEAQRAAATEAKDALKAFASIRWDASAFHYYDELARRQIVATTVWPEFTESYMAERDPYIWQYAMGTERQFGNLGEWACKRIAGKNATHAGSPDVQTKPRKFGVITQTQRTENVIDNRPLIDELKACGHGDTFVAPRFSEDDDMASVSSNIAIQMRQAGVTSVFCLCHVFGATVITKAATTQGYYPELIVTTYNLFDYNWSIRTWVQPDQRKQLFGLTFIPRQLAPAKHPARWAEKDTDPGSVQFEDGFLDLSRSYTYQNLLLLASGLQMAGPKLTPHSFRDGMHRTKFPNPPHPNVPGTVGFTDRDHGMTNDGAEWYWMEAGRSPFRDENYGTICYVEGGRRYFKGAWPKGGDPFFTLPCDSGAEES